MEKLRSFRYRKSIISAVAIKVMEPILKARQKQS